MTDSGMLAFLLRRVRVSVLFLAPFDKIQRKMLKLALQVHSGGWEEGGRDIT